MLVLGVATFVAPAAWGFPSLDDIARQVERAYPEIAHMAPETLATLLDDTPERVLVLDVRKPAEFAVSHIPGAERVDPAMTAERFRQLFAKRLAGMTVVLYCSVGMRSSRLAGRIAADARALGAESVHNLRGGIFAWHNLKLPLEVRGSATNVVHPYGPVWSRYIAARDRIRYAPPLH